MENKDTKKDLNRRKFLRFGFNTFAGFAVGGVAGIVAIRAEIEDYVWQLILIFAFNVRNVLRIVY